MGLHRVFQQPSLLEPTLETNQGVVDLNHGRPTMGPIQPTSPLAVRSS